VAASLGAVMGSTSNIGSPNRCRAQYLSRLEHITAVKSSVSAPDNLDRAGFIRHNYVITALRLG
jgi:hypothetical protein